MQIGSSGAFKRPLIESELVSADDYSGDSNMSYGVEPYVAWDGDNDE